MCNVISYDGSNWFPTNLNVNLRAIVWTGTYWLAPGATTYKSFDGSNWISYAAPTYAVVGDQIGVEYNGNMFISFGSEGPAGTKFQYSFDGSNWTRNTSDTAFITVETVLWTGRMWIRAIS